MFLTKSRGLLPHCILTNMLIELPEFGCNLTHATTFYFFEYILGNFNSSAKIFFPGMLLLLHKRSNYSLAKTVNYKNGFRVVRSRFQPRIQHYDASRLALSLIQLWAFHTYIANVSMLFENFRQYYTHFLKRVLSTKIFLGFLRRQQLFVFLHKALILFKRFR